MAARTARSIRFPSQRLLWVLPIIAGCSLAAVDPEARVSPGEQASVGDAPSRYRESIPGTVVDFEMIRVPAGSVTIDGSEGRRRVEVGPFYMGVTEVTWDVYDLFVFGVGAGPGPAPLEEGVSRPSRPYVLPGEAFGHAGRPALGMSYMAAERFAEWLSRQTGRTYRLPTEAEWEYACRAGRDPPADLGSQAWHAANSSRRTQPVGSLEPNGFGLHDLLGNAAEWVSTLDGEPVVKGGAFEDPASQVTCSARQEWAPWWQETDPQLPKSRWWFSDAHFVGLRIVADL